MHIESVRAFTPEAMARLSWSRERIREEQVRPLAAGARARAASFAVSRSPAGARRSGNFSARRSRSPTLDVER